MDNKTFNPPLHGELVGSSTCTAAGITAIGSTPVLLLCRRLIEAGHDPATPLEAWRGDIRCLWIRSIGQAAALELNSEGTGFRRRRQPDAAKTAAETRTKGTDLEGRGNDGR